MDWKFITVGNSVMRHSKLWFVLLLLLITTTFKCSLALSVIAKYPQSTQSECYSNHLLHMAVDKSFGGSIYIGAVNKIIQLKESNLTVETCVKTGPFGDSPQCPASGCPISSPQIETSLTDNYNKILVIDLESRILIACGSIFQGACYKYKLSNVSLPSQFVPVSIAANTDQASTYAFIGPEHYNNWGSSNVLYVGTTFTKNGDYRSLVPAISSRNLYNLNLAENHFKQSSLDINVSYRDRFLVKYIYGFNSSDYAYFVVVQKCSHLPGMEETGYVTRLARVCIDDANYDSYTEVTLECMVNETSDSNNLVNYNLAQDLKLSSAGKDLADSLGIDVDDQVLVGSFSPSQGITNEPSTQSAICVFSMHYIESKFDENIHMCFNGTVKYRNMPYVSGIINQGNCPTAGSTGNILNFCEVGLKISGTRPISTQAAINFPNYLITSVTLATTENNTISFLGTSTGALIKVLLSNATYGVTYEELILDNGNIILPDTALSSNGEHLYVLTHSNVLKVRVEHCNTFTNCSSCLEANDPYCGWCSLERRCTVKSTCQKASQNSPRWLSLGTGQQCIDFEKINPDRIPIHQPYSLLQLVIKPLPELPPGAKYRCVFGKSDPLDAVVTPYGLECLAPSVLLRPKIPKNQDHIYVSLSVRSSETNKDFVSRNFAYYDCSAHTRCMDCVESQWACNWCVYENKCTNNITSCQRMISVVISGENNPVRLESHGAMFCPRFIQPAQKILLPNGVPKEIVLQVENLPSPQVGHTGFQCIINIEGAKLMVPARVEEKYIVCDKTTYSYETNSGEYDAMVSMVWNRNHHVDTINVTLYKCDILGSHREHADCSLCVTRNRKYHCTWCSNTCVYSETCFESSSNECPRPRIDMIKPLSGPVEGGTLVTIEGSNLGLNKEDVWNKIHIGNILCHLVDYQVSVKIVCKTGPSSVEKVASIVVGNNAGITESSVYFSYKSVKLDRVTPSVGPQSGGTLLAISGHNLNIGSSVTAFLDKFPCTVNTTHVSSTRLTCVTSAANRPLTVNAMHLIIDGSNRTLSKPFTYRSDPSVAEIKPLISFLSGGRMITVHGTNFDIIQKPEMVIYSESNFNHPINKSECVVLNSAQMECPSPSSLGQFLKNTNKSFRKRRRHATNGKYNMDSFLTLKVGFIMDNVLSVKDLEKHLKVLQSQIIYVLDPKYFQFANTIKSYNGDTLVIEGENLNLACDESDVNVTIGLELCNITSLANTQLVCIPPRSQPQGVDDFGFATKSGLPLVVVRVGKNLKFSVGYLQYDVSSPYSFSPEAITGAVTGALCIMIIFFIILFLYRRKSTQAEREYKRIQIQMDTLESNVRSECKQAFAELQTDMTDLTADLESSGIPTLNHNEYILKVFFPGVRDHPILNDSKAVIPGSETNYDAAMIQFEQLINNKHFVLSFIDTLESQKTFSIRDKVNVASLLMVVLIDKMDYATDILRSLLLRLIDKSVMSKHPHMMLRRTESVVEKMLTNWMALNMYTYLTDYAGASLFLLYKAIKYQVDKGPVDALTYDARYSLSEDRLLREQIEHNVVNLYVSQDDDKVLCKVLDCDTISQVKSKILDAVYKNTAFSLRPSIYDVDLEWRHGRGGHLTLQDIDVTTKTISGWKKLNTLAHYGVKDTAVMTLISRQHDIYNKNCLQSCQGCTSAYYSSAVISTSNGGIDAGSSSNSSVYHLTRCTDSQQQYPNKIPERIHKAIPEIYLTRLLSTKGTIQKFVDDFFSTILAADKTLPPAVKWLFDLFDEAAKKYSITDPEVVHSWKSNSLPLRFWVNFIKNPDFIFDIDKTPTVDSCLSVIAQTFMDSCSTSDHRLGKDSPSNKLLFAKDIPQYRETVLRFYSNIQKLPQITDQELSTTMQQLSTFHFGQFHIVSALKELYIYASKYNDAILDSLETDPYCQKINLSHKLNKVAGTLEGDGGTLC